MLMGSSNIELVHGKPDRNPFGISLNEWTVQWWRWLLSIPKEKSPAADYTGSNAAVGQREPVFFLCQTIEGVESLPIRRITIPRGHSIFMPLINWISTLHVNGETDKDLIKVASQKMDSINNLELVINGQPYFLDCKKLRYTSRVFQVALPESNILDAAPGMTRCCSDGYWLFFKINTDNLRLDTFGSCSSGITRIGVSYDIHVR
jgi:hypothetical protein